MAFLKSPFVPIKFRGQDLNLRPPGYAYHRSFRCPAAPVCGLDFPFAFQPWPAAKAPAVKSLHLLQVALELGSGLPPPEAFPTLTGDHTQVSSRAAQFEINSQASR